MPQFPATIQVRTTLEQVGRISGLAGDLETTEAEVTRQLLTMALEQHDATEQVRSRLASDRRARRASEDRFEAMSPEDQAAAVRAGEGR